jgi:GDP-4-dehydro-6-deoxy-D-mannose reductase
VSAGDQVRLLAELLAPVEIVHEVDPNRVRASEVMDLRGDHSLLTGVTGWKPEIPLRQTMADTIDWWERELESVGRA